MSPKEQLLITGKFELRPYSAKQLYELYGVSDKTFAKWLEPFKEQIGKKLGAFYTIHQVKMILEKIGTPGLFIDLTNE